MLKAEILRKLGLYGAQLFTGQVTDAKLLDPVEDGTGEPSGTWTATLSDGQVIVARSLVLDFSRNAARTEFLTRLAPELSSGRVRVHAAIDISHPAWLSEGQSALAMRNGWTVRVESLQGEPTRAFLSSHVLAEPPSLDGLNVVLAHTLQGLSLQSLQHAEWSTGVAAAPFATQAEREMAEFSVTGLSERTPRLLAVGRSLFGDDLSSSLAAAHEGAVTLRRQLTGLSV